MTRTSDLLNIGYDLDAQAEVHIGDRPLPQWHALGYTGTRRIVCYVCWRGIDAEMGTQIALVARGRLGGRNRPHFAHPPGTGRHDSRAARETIWHLNTKHRLARWAAMLPNVVSAIPERWTPDGKRRADVSVLLRDGSRLALEAQSRIITDRHWRDRHADYAAAGIHDVWFLAPGTEPPHVLFDLAVQAFVIHDRGIDVPLGGPHLRGGDWWEGDLRLLSRHPPAVSGRLDPVSAA